MNPHSGNAPFRAVHLTDIHLREEPEVLRAVEMCFTHVARLRPAANLVIFGGDIVDWTKTPFTPAQWEARWDIFTRLRDQHLHEHVATQRIIYCPGNHDLDCNDPAMVKAAFGMDPSGPMYGMWTPRDNANWAFVTLDSVGGFPVCALDPPKASTSSEALQPAASPKQLEHLRRCLDAARSAEGGRNLVVISHVPIVSLLPEPAPGGGYFDGAVIPNYYCGGIETWIHTDGREMHELFVRSGSVRLCLSGHLHKRERLDFPDADLRLTYICDGAVSGNGWRPNVPRAVRAEPGYGCFDFFEDGTFEARYEGFGWKAH